MLRKVLLASGIVAPLLYAVSDVVAGMRWEGYSSRDQTISELGLADDDVLHRLEHATTVNPTSSCGASESPSCLSARAGPGERRQVQDFLSIVGKDEPCPDRRGQ